MRLTNSGVPVSLTDSDADEIFPTDVTAQPLERYVEPLNVAGIVNTEGESDEPLLRISIIRFIKLNATLIGVRNAHVLCAYLLDLHNSWRCVDGNNFSRRTWRSVLPQATISALPRSRTGRSSTLLRTKGDQIPRTIKASFTDVPPLRSVGPTSVGTSREEGDGVCRIQVDDHSTDRDPQLCSEGDGAANGN